jgi:hypothetical protein
MRRSSVAVGISLALGVAAAQGACTSFGEAGAETADAGAEAAAPDGGGGPGACAAPAFVDNPSAQRDDVCGGAKVDLSASTAHCGACDHACSACTNGLCPLEPIAGAPSAAVAAVFGDAVYYASKAGIVGRVGGATFSPSLGTAEAKRIDADATSVWAATAEKVVRFDLASGTGEVVPGATASFVVGDSAVFYVDGTKVVKLPKQAGPAMSVDAPGASAIAAAGDDAFWVATARVEKGTAVVGPFGAPKEIATSKAIVAVAVDPTHVYFADGETNEVRRVPRTGGSTQPVAKERLGSIERLHVDGDYVYWAAHRGDHYTLVRAAKCGGLPLDLTGDIGQVRQLSTDAKQLLGAEPLTGRILRVAK